jgi:hypothetical protein
MKGNTKELTFVTVAIESLLLWRANTVMTVAHGSR